jgi:septal ring factor EnvC (AmiA/AmiB activator)
VSSVPRHSEEELRQQWAFLDALVDRQAASLKSGIQDPEEDDLTVPMVAADTAYLEEISTLTQRVTSLEDERTTLLRRIDLSEEARMAAESARAAAEAARVAAERSLAAERARGAAAPAAQAPGRPTPAPRVPPAPPVPGAAPGQGRANPPAAAKSRRKTWWQRIRE